MFVSLPNKSLSVVEEAKADRESRAREKIRVDAAILIQSLFRRCLCIKHLRAEQFREFDQIFPTAAAPIESTVTPAVTAEDAFAALRQFFFMFNAKEDRDRFRRVCQYLIASIGSDKSVYSYMSILQKTESVAVWRRQVLFILRICVGYLQPLRPEQAADAKDLILYSQVIIILTHSSQWKAVRIPNETVRNVMNGLTAKWMQELVRAGLYPALRDVLLRGMARTKPSLTAGTLFPLLTLLVRPMVLEAFATDVDKQKAVIGIFSVPGFMLHVETICPVFIDTFRKLELLRTWNGLLTTDQAWLLIKKELTTSSAVLSVVANLAYGFWLSRDEAGDVDVLHVVSTIIFLLDLCNEIGGTHKSAAASKWHPIFGWSTDRIDQSHLDAIGFVQQQLQVIWRKDFVKTVFGRSVERKMESVVAAKKSEIPPAGGPSKATVMLQRLGLSAAKSTSKLKLSDGEVSRFAIVSAMYQTAINTLVRLRLDILTGLCVQGALPSTLWSMIKGIGVQQFVELLKPSANTYTTEFQLLGLFCNLSAHLITIMDDLELYEEQKIFTIADLSEMAKFLNELVFRIIWDELMPVGQLKMDPLFTTAHRLLQLLYQRNSRRRFAPDEHWIMNEAKGSSFFNELKEKRSNAQQLLTYAPHCIPHHDRVKLFRQWIKEERAAHQDASVTPILITVQRKRIVEDGYQHISQLTPEELKGVIRVRFINAEGVAEAGIDQDGVFKEFLEETIKRVFDPNLHLFKTTVDNRIYPSPTSNVQDNHLELISFVGRVLGKAVYEGIVVDVPLANFFLSHILRFHTVNPVFSYFDELASFDADLYRNLSTLKRYPGDVAELGLNFTCDEDRLGQIISHDLGADGGDREVTEENKILYIHYMAHFRMHQQIKDQLKAFIQGFLSIVKPEWVAIFSPPELQKLISGDSQSIDLRDLRKHTSYYGGFHSSHRVVGWLWDVLEKDFTEEERGLFLKFVTSCSKPPLLGFAYLDPPFSIRCVEVGEDQDSGDTLGSVFRGFFTIGKKKGTTGRLPTSSTCFNLLKLPNYPKKSILREKLRYAIRSNSGFELS
ncbi:Ubiquitin-protein ligase E3B [Hypsibius exemplaris]|uniref:Ubiquitin-protein ligase E3B n=1 Tax=Hypsibius exemplaris TaxID=2072580 RepID=A0A1W0WMY2_HYPEX|nr:Ubiquitin-protein ligase E3B [Hypsibius exemplaris]